MISNELYARYEINPHDIDVYGSMVNVYKTFLLKTDYVSNKIAEALYLNTAMNEDYTEVLQARAYARQQIRLLNGTDTE